jgi:hypothetical protein
MNTKFAQVFVLVLWAMITGITAEAQSTYSNAIISLNPAGYWPMHEVAPPAPGDIETNYGTLGTLGTGYYSDWWVNNGAPGSNAILHQIPGALANDPDTATFFMYPNTGSNTYMVVPHTSPLTTLTPPFTIELWMMASNTAFGDLVSQDGTVLNTGNGNNQYGVRVTWGAGSGYSDANTFFQVYNGITTGAGYVTNQWHYVVMTCDTSSNYVIYVDNGVAGTKTASGIKPDSWDPLTIGAGLWNAGGVTRETALKLDEVAIYTNVLSVADIGNHWSIATSPSSAAGDYYNAVIANSPLLYYRMNSPSYAALPPTNTWPVLKNYGTTATNGVYMPGVAPGSVSGPKFLGLSGTNAMPGNGVSAFADAGFAPAFNPTNHMPLSIAACFKGNPAEARFQSIVGHSDNSWRMALDPTGKLHFNAGAGSEITSPAVYNDGNWYQAVGVYDGTSNYLYVGGVLVAQILTTNAIPGTNSDVLLGADPQYLSANTGAGRQFAGNLCEVAFFTNALTAAQVQNLFNQSGVPPVITGQPAAGAINGAVNFTNSVTGGGSGPFSYQWYHTTVSNYLGAPAIVDNSRVFGSTTNKLVILNAQGSDAGYYFVVVTNSVGSVTSSIVPLTVYTSPTILGQFPLTYTNPISLFGGTSPTTVGSSPTFSASVVGQQPAYQWMANGAPVASGTASSFTFTNCQMTSPTSFQCVATNIYGSVTSMTWTVRYIPAPTNPVPQLVLAARPVGYWRLNEPDDQLNDGNAGAICNDYQGGNNGIYTNVYLGNSQGGTGYSPTTDSNTTAAYFGYYAASGCFADWIGTNIDFSVPNGGNGAFTVAVWANGNFTTQVGNAGLVTKGYFNGEQFTIDEGAANQSLRFVVRNAAAGTVIANSTNRLAADANWHFVVGVCDQANGKVSLYIDGAFIASASSAAGSGILSSPAPLMIGARSSNPTPMGNNQFRGFLNDVAIYNYALSTNQILAQWAASGTPPYFITPLPTSVHVNYGGILTITPQVGGSPPFTYKWFDVTANAYIPGQTNATLVISNYTVANSYYVTVSGRAGSVDSTPVYADALSGAPQIYTYAQDPFYGIEGLSATNSVEAYGTAPLAYQWQLFSGTSWVNLTDNARISGSHSSALTIAPVYPSDAGSYQVIITNALGSANSTATLIVVGFPLGFNTNGLFWTANGSARFSANVLSLTDPNNGGGNGSTFFQAPQYIGAFAAAFTYQAQSAGTGLADGTTFCLQTDSRGTAATGGGGGNLGVSGITPSAQLMLDVFGGSAFAFGFNGTNVPASGANSPNFRSAGSVLLNSGHPIDITVAYANGQMALTFADAVAATSFSTNFNVGDLTQVLSADAAYVGFTASYGGQTSVQTISNFRFLSLPTLAIQLNGRTNAVLAWPGSILGYTPQQNSDLTTPNWLSVTSPDTITNGQHRVVVPVGNANQFYRLKLQQ